MAKKTGRPPKLTPEYKALIVEYVRTHGVLARADTVLPEKVSRVTISDAMNPEAPIYDPDFAAAIAQAKHDYKDLCYKPSEDPNLRKLTRKALEAMIGSGQNTETTFTKPVKDEKTGKIIDMVIEKKTTSKAGIPAWVWYVVNPVNELSKQSLEFFLSAQVTFLMQGYAKDEGTFRIVSGFLHQFTLNALDELDRKGIFKVSQKGKTAESLDTLRQALTEESDSNASESF